MNSSDDRRAAWYRQRAEQEGAVAARTAKDPKGWYAEGIAYEQGREAGHYANIVLGPYVEWHDSEDTWLRQRRKGARLSLRAFAARVGLSAPYLCDVELGRRNCTPRIRAFYEGL